MTTQIDDIKAKIRALLAKAESSEHEGEASLFLAKAQELMAKHQLELFELHNSDPLGWLFPDTRYQAGPMAYKSQVHYAVGEYYGCKAVKVGQVFRSMKASASNTFIEGWKLEFAGTESSRVTTELMFPFIWDQVNKQAKWVSKETGMNVSKAVREVAKALTCRIVKLIRARKAVPPPTVGSCFALVAVNQIDGLMAERFGELKHSKPKTITLQAAAKRAAEGINLSRQMNSSETLRLK